MQVVLLCAVRVRQLVGAFSLCQQFDELHECEQQRQPQQQQQRVECEWGLPVILIHIVAMNKCESVQKNIWIG